MKMPARYHARVMIVKKTVGEMSWVSENMATNKDSTNAS